MHFVSPARIIRRALFGALAIATVLTAHGCAEGLSPLTSAESPQELTVTVLRPGAIRLSWKPASAINGTVRAYLVQRREDFTGAFTEVARIEPNSLAQLLWIDTDVRPETVYGYRVIAVTSLGDQSLPSTVGGAITPPPPGIEIVTSAQVISAESIDPDGYEVMIMGPDTVRAVLSPVATKRFSPLKTGTYTVSLSGLIERCALETPSVQVVVTDTTAVTLAKVRFDVTCRDPNRGNLTVAVKQTGVLLDPSVTVDVLGQASDTTLPVAQRVFSAQRTVTVGSPNVTFTNVRPGTYTVNVKDISSNCTLTGTPARSANIRKLSIDTVTYAVACRDTAPPPPTSNAPFIWRNRWTPKTGPANSAVVLESSLDLTARTGQNVKGIRATITYDPAVLRYESDDAGQINQLTVNGATPGVVEIVGLTSGAARTGVVSLYKLNFTAIGANGATSASGSLGVQASSQAGGAPAVSFSDSVRVVEDTFTVGTGGGAANQPPTARAGGPYTGTAGAALTLSGAGSTDADGTIASYAWTFGDNTSGTGASPSKTYAAAGTFTATLTVTDNRGATATSQAQVTISPAGGSTAPVARANGPYTATVGVPVTLSSAGSTNATSFSWALGNGQTATGVSPSVTYSAACTCAITLTATAAGGATSTATTSITVTAAAPPPPPPPPPTPTTLEWKNLFGPFDVANNTVSITILYDTRVNLVETPGPEALERFTVDSLKWDPSVLQFVSINLGPNITGNSVQTGVTAGRIGLSGTIGGSFQQGLITIATIRLRPVGSPNASTTTRTFLGALLGPSSTNFYSYNSKTLITEGQFTVP